jgi:hypothetical protein
MAPTSGMGMMLKSLGIDPDEIKASIEQFMLTMQSAAERIKENQSAIETRMTAMDAKLDRIAALIDQPGDTIHVQEDGRDTGILITSEKFPQAMLDDLKIDGGAQ